MTQATNHNTGGAAFPMSWVKQEAPNLNVILEQRGMTLRDYFAAKAMPVVITDWLNTGDIFQDPEIAEVIARDCYIVADAMLKARAA
jgi:hypothetical protein